MNNVLVVGPGISIIVLMVLIAALSPSPKYVEACDEPVVVCDRDQGPDFRLIKDSATALSMGRAIYSVYYGEDTLQSYRAQGIGDSLWIVTSTLPPGYLGGGVEIHFDSRNAKILYLCHYK